MISNPNAELFFVDWDCLLICLRYAQINQAALFIKNTLFAIRTTPGTVPVRRDAPAGPSRDVA
jgi:hypothetical protein